MNMLECAVFVQCNPSWPAVALPLEETVEGPCNTSTDTLTEAQLLSVYCNVDIAIWQEIVIKTFTPVNPHTLMENLLSIQDFWNLTKEEVQELL